VQSAAFGSYDVVVTYVAGSASSAAVPLALNVALQFTAQLAGLALNPGGTGVLSVAEKGAASVTYHRRKNVTAIE
jgi:hypothetical protein